MKSCLRETPTRRKKRMLVTGATGMIGSFVVRLAVREGYDVVAVHRANSDRSLLDGVRCQMWEGDLAQPKTILPAFKNVDYVVHTAAHIGDWGPPSKYRATNVDALASLLNAAARVPLKRFIHVSSLGVYPARHHFGTDETTPADLVGLDGYTRTKAEAELVVQRFIDEKRVPAVIVRPGFTYGPGDRHVIPRLIKQFDAGVVKFIGNGKTVLNNTYVGNFADAIFLALKSDAAVGETFNIRDERLVTREEYLMAVADYLGKPRPARVPLWLAKSAAPFFEHGAKLIGAKQPPLLTGAVIKFMALNLDFSIDKAKSILGYEPSVDFQHGMKEALDWAAGQRNHSPLRAAA